MSAEEVVEEVDNLLRYCIIIETVFEFMKKDWKYG